MVSGTRSSALWPGFRLVLVLICDSCYIFFRYEAPSFGFIVVQKRINTRIFALGGKNPDNPAAGTVLDHTVTKRDWFDFFLVSQHVGQVRNEST